MTGNDKTLRETVAEVVGETISHSSETHGGISKSQSGETSSGGTPEYVAGIDISDIPEQDRPRIKAKLESKLALLEKGYQPKFQEVASLKKSLEWLNSKGLTAEKAEAILIKAVEGEKLTTTEKKKLDKLIQDSPYEQKEALQNMRQIILEETDVGQLRAEVADLKKVVNYFQGKDMQLGENQLNQDLGSLREKFGKDFVDKYEEAIRGEWRKYPNSKAKDILKYIALDEEYEQAILSKGNRNKEKQNAVTNVGGGVTSSSATMDVRKTGWKDLLTAVINEKKG